MNAEGKSRYFKEVARNLQRCGFESEGLNGDGLLPVRWQGQPLCIQEVAGYRLRCVSIYAMLLQRKSPMRIIIHIGRGMFSISPAMSEENQVQQHRRSLRFVIALHRLRNGYMFQFFPKDCA